MITLPLRSGASNAHQVFSIQLGDNFLEFTLNYITVFGPAWSVDIRREGELLVAGAMLEPGAILTESYNAGIGKLYFEGEDVTLDNIGKDNRLVWVSDDE